MAGNTTRSEAVQSFFVYVKDSNTNVIKRVAIPGDVQIGLEGRPSELHLLGRLAIAAKSYSTDQSNKGTINISNDDTAVGVQLSVVPLSGRIKVNLPPTPREGQLHFIKDTTGTVGSTPIDVIPAAGTLIDRQTSKTLTTPYDSLALIWLSGEWQVLVAGASASGGSVSPNLSFVTINPESTLTAERHLTGSTNIIMTDEGSNGRVYFDLSRVLTGSAGTFSYATVSVDQWGRITTIAAGATPVTLAGNNTFTGNDIFSNGLTGSLQQTAGGASYLVASNSITITSQSNGQIVIGSTAVTATGNNTFTGNDIFNAGLTGSLQQTAGGLSYLVPSGSITITSQSNGQIIVGSNGVTTAGNNTFTGNDIFNGGLTGSLQLTVGGVSYLVASGAITIVSQSNGQIVIGSTAVSLSANNTFTGNDIFNAGLTGSVQQTAGGLSYLVASGSVTIVSQSNGQIVIGSTGLSPSANNTFTANNIFNAGLTGSLQLTAGGLSYLVASGPITIVSQSNGQILIGSTAVTLSANNTFTGNDTFNAGLTGSLQKTAGGLSYLVASGSITIVSQSNGQIIIGSTGGSSSSGSGGSTPIYTMQFMAGTVPTNTAHSLAKQSLGTIFFKPSLISNFTGTKRFYWRAIVDTLSSETNLSASVDMYDINGIVQFPPGIVPNSTMASSNPTMTQLEVDLTSVLTSVTGSGIFEARLWRTVSGTLQSSVTCRNARLDLEIT